MPSGMTRNWYQTISHATVRMTSRSVAERGATLARGAPSVRYRPASVRACGDWLKAASATGMAAEPTGTEPSATGSMARRQRRRGGRGACRLGCGSGCGDGGAAVRGRCAASGAARAARERAPRERAAAWSEPRGRRAGVGDLVGGRGARAQAEAVGARHAQLAHVVGAFAGDGEVADGALAHEQRAAADAAGDDLARGGGAEGRDGVAGVVVGAGMQSGW